MIANAKAIGGTSVKKLLMKNWKGSPNRNSQLQAKDMDINSKHKAKQLR
jgi:hypothetical protein